MTERAHDDTTDSVRRRFREARRNGDGATLDELADIGARQEELLARLEAQLGVLATAMTREAEARERLYSVVVALFGSRWSVAAMVVLFLTQGLGIVALAVAVAGLAGVPGVLRLLEIIATAGR